MNTYPSSQYLCYNFINYNIVAPQNHIKHSWKLKISTIYFYFFLILKKYKIFNIYNRKHLGIKAKVKIKETFLKFGGKNYLNLKYIMSTILIH